MKEDVSTATELNILIQVKFHTNCMSNFIGFDVLLIVNKLEPRWGYKYRKYYIFSTYWNKVVSANVLQFCKRKLLWI